MYRRTNYILFPGFVAAAVAATMDSFNPDPQHFFCVKSAKILVSCVSVQK
jgi:hypothetical protein